MFGIFPSTVYRLPKKKTYVTSVCPFNVAMTKGWDPNLSIRRLFVSSYLGGGYVRGSRFEKGFFGWLVFFEGDLYTST